MSIGVEEVAARAVGKLGVIQATVSGLTGVFTRLVEEHRQLATLLVRAEISSDAVKRAELWARIRPELWAHERAEADVLYREVERHATLRAIARQHDADEAQLHALVHNLDQAAFTSAQWEGSLKQLQVFLKRHTTREEQHFFPQILEVVGEQRAKELEYEYLRAKQTPTHDG